jgi:hypothetical protein
MAARQQSASALNTTRSAIAERVFLFLLADNSF